MDLLKSQKEEPVECSGQTFANDKEHRNHFLKLLDEKLKDPEFCKQEGFLQGTDEAILAMSDPPYYTACPNPWLADFVAYYGKPFTTLRALTGISLMPTGQLTGFDGKLDKLKSCASLVHSELVASPVCPHCSFRPANEQGELLPAANVLKSLDDELDRMLADWQQTLLDNLENPIIQANFELLKDAQRNLIQGFLKSRNLPDPVILEFVASIQEALSGLEKIVVTSGDIKKALLTGGSPATPEDLRKRFESFLNERCKGKDTSKLRFVVE